jgi:hypothetical protein
MRWLALGLLLLMGCEMPAAPYTLLRCTELDTMQVYIPTEEAARRLCARVAPTSWATFRFEVHQCVARWRQVDSTLLFIGPDPATCTAPYWPPEKYY